MSERTALIISGLQRHVEKCYPNIKWSLLDTNKPDVFIHTWKDLDGGVNPNIESLYQPKVMKVEEQKTWANSTMVLDRMMLSHGRSYHRDKFVEMLYSSWYSTQQANLLKEEYRLKNDLKYHHVIRCRFDLHFSTPIDCSHFDNRILSVCNRWLPDHDMVDDRFAIGSNEIMNAYCSGFNLLDIIQSKREGLDGIFCGETLVYEICQILNIPHQKIDSLTCENIAWVIQRELAAGRA